MKKKVRGSAVVTAIVVIAIVGAVAVGVYFLLKNLPHLGGGGASVVPANAETAVVTETVTEITEETVSTEELQFIKVTVRGKEYIFEDKVYELDALVDMLAENSGGVPVLIEDDNASRNAYTDLCDALNENNIRYR